jgi:hypothetical protein
MGSTAGSTAQLHVDVTTNNAVQGIAHSTLMGS